MAGWPAPPRPAPGLPPGPAPPPEQVAARRATTPRPPRRTGRAASADSRLPPAPGIARASRDPRPHLVSRGGSARQHPRPHRRTPSRPVADPWPEPARVSQVERSCFLIAFQWTGCCQGGPSTSTGPFRVLRLLRPATGRRAFLDRHRAVARPSTSTGPIANPWMAEGGGSRPGPPRPAPAPGGGLDGGFPSRAEPRRGGAGPVSAVEPGPSLRRLRSHGPRRHAGSVRDPPGGTGPAPRPATARAGSFTGPSAAVRRRLPSPPPVRTTAARPRPAVGGRRGRRRRRPPAGRQGPNTPG